MDKSRSFHVSAAILLILAGLAFCDGGVALLRVGDKLWPGIRSGSFAVHVVAAGLLAVGIFLTVAWIAVLLDNRIARPLGIAAAMAFGADAMLSYYVLFGTLSRSYAIVLTVVAAATIYFLSKGSAAPEAETSDADPPGLFNEYLGPEERITIRFELQR